MGIHLVKRNEAAFLCNGENDIVSPTVKITFKKTVGDKNSKSQANKRHQNIKIPVTVREKIFFDNVLSNIMDEEF
jgi:hypothetical protein